MLNWRTSKGCAFLFPKKVIIMVQEMEKKARRKATGDEVMSEIAERLPSLLNYFYYDRDWLWYCGPSLKDDEASRTVLKTLGFRWAKRGHTMQDGVTIGTWSHSLQRPLPPRRFNKQRLVTKQDESSQDLSSILDSFNL